MTSRLRSSTLRFTDIVSSGDQSRRESASRRREPRRKISPADRAFDLAGSAGQESASARSNMGGYAALQIVTADQLAMRGFTMPSSVVPQPPSADNRPDVRRKSP